MATVSTKKNRSGLGAKPWELVDGKITKARGRLPHVDNPGPIAMIDMGQVEINPGVYKHKDFGGTATGAEPLALGNPSKSGHAMAVAGLIEALCNDGKLEIVHYNVWSEQRLELNALKAALNHIATSNPPPAVLNLSIGIKAAELGITETNDLTALIQLCIHAGVVVVAGVGEFEDPSAAFPANVPGVIAVSAVDPHDRPIKGSNRGAVMGAPGDRVHVMEDDDAYEYYDGSSYAAAVVSSAIWLVMRTGKGGLKGNPAATRAKLGKSVNKPKPPVNAMHLALVGDGVLDFDLL